MWVRVGKAYCSRDVLGLILSLSKKEKKKGRKRETRYSISLWMEDDYFLGHIRITTN